MEFIIFTIFTITFFAAFAAVVSSLRIPVAVWQLNPAASPKSLKQDMYNVDGQSGRCVPSAAND
jgi:hypothetical protein